MADLQKELKDLKIKFGFYKKENCLDEENQKFKELRKNDTPLPDDIYYASDIEMFYRYVRDENISEDEFKDYIYLLKAKNINTIKNCFVFFTTLTVIGMVLGIILYFISYAK